MQRKTSRLLDTTFEPKSVKHINLPKDIEKEHARARTGTLEESLPRSQLKLFCIDRDFVINTFVALPDRIVEGSCPHQLGTICEPCHSERKQSGPSSRADLLEQKIDAYETQSTRDQRDHTPQLYDMHG